MLNQFKISTRLNLGFTAILLLMSASLIPVALSKITDVVQQAETRELSGLAKSAQAEIESEGHLAQAMSALVANLDSVQRQFAEGDRDALAKTMVPVFKQLKDDYAVRQFQFHTPPATSFLRAHKPEKFGDDLSGFRATVLATNREQKPIRGLEKGVAGLGIRGISPVSYEGKHIGSVEFGLSFGQPFFEQFKEKYGVDIALHVERDNTFKAFGSTLASSLLSPEQMRTALQGASPILQTALNGTPYAVMGARVDDFSGNAVGVLEIAMDRSHYAAAIANARNLTLGIGALVLIGGLFIAWIISRSITVPLHKTTAAMNDIAQGGGDLTQRLTENGKDEIASLAAAFNRFAEKVRLMVTQVAGSTTSLASSAEEMSVITNETKQGVQEQLAETEQVATAINEMAATAQSVSSHAADAADAASAADQEAGEGQAVVRHTIETINLLATDIESAVGVINALEQNSESIGGVLEVIGAIAEQTNLLALNAAIEAARAGDQGRGFAVVADEVRTLAHRTQESTQEIKGMIETLQAGARDAVSAMNQSSSRSQECVEQAASAGSSLETITRSIARINDMNLQIASAAAEQTTVSDEINRNVSNIRGQVERTAQSAQQTNTAGTELAGLAAQLQSLVSQFKT